MVAGAAARRARRYALRLFGPEAEMRAGAGRRAPRSASRSSTLRSTIGNDDEPARAARSKPEASIVQAARAVADGRADALVSAGSTGAALAASLLHVKRLPGVYRPAVAVPLPLPGGTVVLLDAGANVEVRPEHLVQFAHMGAAFSERVLGVERPRVGLLSVGEEPGKGTPDGRRGARAAVARGSSSSPATSRATTFRRRSWTWSSPTASRATWR